MLFCYRQILARPPARPTQRGETLRERGESGGNTWGGGGNCIEGSVGIAFFQFQGFTRNAIKFLRE